MNPVISSRWWWEDWQKNKQKFILVSLSMALPIQHPALIQDSCCPPPLGQPMPDSVSSAKARIFKYLATHFRPERHFDYLDLPSATVAPL
jgi:hypothetical protein